MKIVRYINNKKDEYGIFENDVIYQGIGNVFSDDFKKGNPVGGVEVISLLAPCEPSVIISIGANYVDRCKENNLKIPETPGEGDKFIVGLEALTGPGSVINLPTLEEKVDFSGELAIVIGKEGKNIKEENAHEYILGYTVVHNVWAKGIPSEKVKLPPGEKSKWLRAYETFCPIGPCIETDIDPDNVKWQTRVNGDVRQDSNTNTMVFNVAQIVADISTWRHLMPGDLIQTGTASGVGTMKHGDIIEIELEGIGILRNVAVDKEGLEAIELIFLDEYKGKA